MTKKITTANYENYKDSIFFIENNPKFELIQVTFSFNAGGWVAPLPKYSDKQTIEYKIVKEAK